MARFYLYLIALATPARDREWAVGDTIEECERLERAHGARAARRWLRREAWRVLLHSPRHRLAGWRRGPAPERRKGDGLVASMSYDVRHALRVLGRAPGFTAIAVATLALGIGANTAMFSVVSAVMLKPLPFREPERLMLVHLLVPDREAGPGVYRESVWSYPKYRTFLEVQRSFDATALFSARDFSVSGDAEPERVRGEVITDAYPGILGIAPILGRGFTFDEAQRPGGSPVALIGHGLWTRRYGADPHLLGRAVQVSGTAYTVAGILPAGFRGLSGTAEVWLPLAVVEPGQLTQRTSHSYVMVARRTPGVSDAEAMAAVRVYGNQVGEAYRQADGGIRRGAAAASLSASRVDPDVRRVSLIVLGAVGFVLLIACVNLANLLLARAIARRREVAIRAAIGATRLRLARQFVVESLVLAGAGLAAGLALAAALLNAAGVLLPDPDVFFRTSIAPGAPRIAGAAGLTRIGASMIGLDARTLLFASAVAIATALLIAVLPAWQASSLRPSDVLKSEAGSTTSRGLRGVGIRGVLVAGQIALALVLLTGAGLMVRSALRLQRTAIGVNADHVLTVRVDLPRASYTPEAGVAFYTRLLDRLGAIPGVDSAALGFCPPVSGGCNTTSLWFPPKEMPTSTDPLIGIHWVTPEYFATLGIPLVRGRSFTGRDRAGQPKVVLINEAAARAFFANQDAIGRRIALGQGGFHDGTATVIGIVADVRYRTIDTAATPDAYVPLAQSSQTRMRAFIRSRVDRTALVAAIRGEVQALDPNLPLVEIKTMDERVGDAMWRTRVSAWLLSAFAALALLLTAIGTFGVMAQAVMQRTREIGIRMALGARAQDVLALVLRRALLLTGSGVLAGAAGAFVLTRFIAALLYGVEPHDPLTFAGVTVLLGAVALAACYVPARRATRVDAVIALRTE
jgi:putative ABC transport system permease protein